MTKIRDLAIKMLSENKQDIEGSNMMWDKRAHEFRKLAYGPSKESYMDFLLENADIKGKTVLDIGSGAGRYMKKLLDQGAIVTGIEPSNGMVLECKDYLLECGYKADSYKLYHMAFQDFVEDEKFDYVFVSNSPIIGYYENYQKILKLAKEGVFVASWLKRKDGLLARMAKILGVEETIEKREEKESSLLLFTNLLFADGYFPSFATIVDSNPIKVKPEDGANRYSDWLFGARYNSEEKAKVEKTLNSLKGQDGLVRDTAMGARGMMFVDLKKRI